VDRAALVHVIPGYAGILNHLNHTWFARLLVVLDPDGLLGKSFLLDESTYDSAILRFTPPDMVFFN